MPCTAVVQLLLYARQEIDRRLGKLNKNRNFVAAAAASRMHVAPDEWKAPWDN